MRWEGKAAFKTFFTLYIGELEDERGEVALTTAEESEPLSTDVSFLRAPSVIYTHRESSPC